jgi:phospholipid transport system substrate-binding protein
MKRWSALAAGLFVALWTSAGGIAAQPTPKEVVESFHASLLTVWKQAREVPAAQRFHRLEPAVKQAFDLNRMIQTAAGTAWAEASESHRQRLVAAFARYITATYVSQFKSYAGQTFVTLGDNPGPRGLILVETQIARSDDAPVAITYVLGNGQDRWQIVDVLLENKISQIAIRRSEYRSIVRAGGAPLLAERLEEQADRLLAEK